MEPAELLSQWICIGPHCYCGGGEEECCCRVIHSEESGRCAFCRSPMHEIDMVTGEPCRPKR